MYIIYILQDFFGENWWFIFFFIISTLGQKLLTKNEAKLYDSNSDEESGNTNITTIPNDNIEIEK